MHSAALINVTHYKTAARKWLLTSVEAEMPSMVHFSVELFPMRDMTRQPSGCAMKIVLQCHREAYQ